jgi:hypothetical protein
MKHSDLRTGLPHQADPEDLFWKTITLPDGLYMIPPDPPKQAIYGEDFFGAWMSGWLLGAAIGSGVLLVGMALLAIS